jgi:hypothetical protein
MSTVVALIALLGLIVLVNLPNLLKLRTKRSMKSSARTPMYGRPSVAASPDPHSPYEPIPALLTAAERDFFAVLRDATPAGFAVYPQVRLAGLVQVKPAARRDKSHWWRIQAKCVDFVLLDAATFAPRLVVELDDSSHLRADRRERDAFVDEVLAAVGIPILHVRWQRRYDVQVLGTQIATCVGLPAQGVPPAPSPRHVHPTHCLRCPLPRSLHRRYLPWHIRRQFPPLPAFRSLPRRWSSLRQSLPPAACVGSVRQSCARVPGSATSVARCSAHRLSSLSTISAPGTRSSCPVVVQRLEVVNETALNLVKQLLFRYAPEDHAGTIPRIPAASSRPQRRGSRPSWRASRKLARPGISSPASGARRAVADAKCAMRFGDCQGGTALRLCRLCSCICTLPPT